MLLVVSKKRSFSDHFTNHLWVVQPSEGSASLGYDDIEFNCQLLRF